MIRFSKVLILLLAVSATAFGQYTGTNPNVAGGKLVVATDSLDGFKPGNAVDGDLGTYASIPGGAGAWIQINLGTGYYIDGYSMVLPNAAELPGNFTVQVGKDGSTWTNLVTQSVGQDSTFSADLDSPDPVQYVRFLMNAKDDPATFAQIYVYGEDIPKPAAPTALDATNITASGFTANWEGSVGATGYVISVATDIGFTNLLPGYDEWGYDIRTWDVTDLDPGTEYFYRNRAFNISGTSTFGNIISVTTEKEAQTITFETLAAATYGDADFDLTATATSDLLVTYSSSEETVATIIGSTVTVVGPGTTTITATQDGDDMYLAADPVMQDLLVNVKSLSVTNAVAANKEYDATTDAAISGATLDGVVGDDVVSLTNAEAGVFAQSTVGAGIVVSTSMALEGADMAKYSLTASPDLSADITAKELTAMAEDKNREACSANPEFTVVYSGFVGSEDKSVMDQEAVASCTADASSPAGAYDITVTGGSAPNYTLVYVSGTLTVSPDVTAPSLEVRNFTLQLDASNNGVITAADVVVSSDDNCAVAETVLSQTVFTESDIGDVNVDVTVSDAAGNKTTKISVVTVVGYVGIDGAEGFVSKVYPNPTYGMVHLELNKFADELKVMDITGKTLIRIANPERQETLDLSDYHSGIYIIQMKFGKYVKYNKVVKK